MDAREKPHCGISGVPFMNNTTGALETAASIDLRVSSERRRRLWVNVGASGWKAERTDGRAAARRALRMVSKLSEGADKGTLLRILNQRLSRVKSGKQAPY